MEMRSPQRTTDPTGLVHVVKNHNCKLRRCSVSDKVNLSDRDKAWQEL